MSLFFANKYLKRRRMPMFVWQVMALYYFSFLLSIPSSTSCRSPFIFVQSIKNYFIRQQIFKDEFLCEEFLEFYFFSVSFILNGNNGINRWILHLLFWGEEKEIFARGRGKEFVFDHFLKPFQHKNRVKSYLLRIPWVN